MNTSDILSLFSYIKAVHPPFDDGDASSMMWRMALTCAGITSLSDAQHAVAMFYSNPDIQDPWIKPGHVIKYVKQIRSQRTSKVETIIPRQNPDDPIKYIEEKKRIVSSIADNTTSTMRAIESQQETYIPPSSFFERIKKQTKLDPSKITRHIPPVDIMRDGQEKPRTRYVKPPRQPTQQEIDAAETNRARQLQLLETMIQQHTGTNNDREKTRN